MTILEVAALRLAVGTLSVGPPLSRWIDLPSWHEGMAGRLPAHVPRDQWLGTVAAEGDINSSADNLYEIVDLDRSRFSILAAELQTGTAKGGKSSVKVYAVDRAQHDLVGASHEEMMAFAQNRGDVPVTQFLVYGVRAEHVMQRVMKRFQVRMSYGHWKDIPMLVDQLDDLRLED